MGSQGISSLDFGGQGTVGFQDQYLDSDVANSFHGDDKCNSEDFARFIMDSHRKDDTHNTGNLLSNNTFGEPATFTSNGLDSSLLNRDFEGNLDYFPSALRPSHTDDGQDHQISSLNGRHCAEQYQQGFVIAPSPRQSTSNFATNTQTSSRPQHLRRSSHLRNEYLPSTELDTSMAGSHPAQVFTSSPSRYTLRPQSGSQAGPTPSQILQPFQESNLRSSAPSFQQLPSYNTVNQMAQYQQLTYPDPQPYSQHVFGFPPYVGHPYKPMPQPNSTTPRFRELAMAPPITPPNLYTSYVGSSEGNSNFHESSSDLIKHESSSAGSPPIPAKRKIRKFRSRAAAKSSNVIGVGEVAYSRTDDEYVEELVDAMTDMSQAEDNIGMKATWTRILEKKADKIRPMCVEMLDLLKRAVNEQLGDKKSANLYPNFEHRFQEFCDAARTQKTIGKHLMEAPYSHTVANDPTYAASRVRNNRRVNGQKRKAITLGRKAMGLAKGKGKGHRLRKLEESPADDVEDDSGDLAEDMAEDTDFSGDDDTFEMDKESYSPVVKSEPPSVRKSTRKSMRRTYSTEPDASPIRKEKKRSRFRHQITDGDNMDELTQSPYPEAMKRPTDNSQRLKKPRPVSRSHKNHSSRNSPSYLPMMSSSPNQRPELNHFHENSHVYGYSPYGHNATSVAPLNLEDNSSFYSQSVLPSSHLSHAYTNYNSEADQDLLQQANHASNADDVTFGGEHKL